MGCGCNKRAQRRSQVITPNASGGNAKIALNSNAQARKASIAPKPTLNEATTQAEKRRVQALRRNAILKSLGKR
jgi:hypothetical protein